MNELTIAVIYIGMGAIASPLLIGLSYVVWRTLREIRETGKQING
jgi:hypothetical protein